MKKKRKVLGTWYWITLTAFILISMGCFLCVGHNFWGWFVPQDRDIPGFIGRLTIDSVNIDVACYEIDPDVHTQEDLKERVDQADSAAYYWQESPSIKNGVRGSWIIADHSYEGFATLKYCETGDSAFITGSDGSVQEYVVTEIFEGINDTYALTVNGESVICDNPDGIILYTCKDFTAIPIYIVFLQPVNS